MTASDLERQLAASLHRHAEEAMSQTDTSSQLRKLQARLDQAEPRRSDRQRATAVAAAVAAAVGVGAFWYATVDNGDERSGPATDSGAQNADERVAQDFVSAFAAGDMEQAASFVGEGAQMPAGWRDTTLAEAYTVEHLLQPCDTTDTFNAGVEIVCPFTYYARRSKELGMEPFGDSMFTVVVDDGEVTSFRAHYAHPTNGEGELREDIGAWVKKNYPGEWQFLDPSVPISQEEEPRFIRLWQKRSQQYADSRNGQVG